MLCWVILATLVPLSLCSHFDTWLSTGDGRHELEQGHAPLFPTGYDAGRKQITINKDRRYQTMEGFGAAITNSAAAALHRSRNYDQIMWDLFGSNGLGNEDSHNYSPYKINYHIKSIHYVSIWSYFNAITVQVTPPSSRREFWLTMVCF